MNDPEYTVEGSARDRLYRIATAFQEFGGKPISWLADIAELIPNEHLAAMEVALDDICAALEATGWAALAWAVDRALQ